MIETHVSRSNDGSAVNGSASIALRIESYSGSVADAYVKKPDESARTVGALKERLVLR